MRIMIRILRLFHLKVIIFSQSGIFQIKGLPGVAHSVEINEGKARSRKENGAEFELREKKSK